MFRVTLHTDKKDFFCNRSVLLCTNLDRQVFKNLSMVLFVLLLSGIPLASKAEQEATAKAEAKIKKEFIEDCLATSNKKYELYRSCIGKFTKACIANPDAYENLRQEFSTGVLHECTEVESKWWQEVYIANAEELKKNTQHYLEEKRISDALNASLSMLRMSGGGCDYSFVRNGFRDGPGDSGELPYPIGFEDNFRCIATTMGENAITVYLWNREFKADRGL